MKNLNLINKPNNRILIFLVPSIFILLYILPYFLLGENLHVTIHDIFDSSWVNYKTLVDSGEIFGSNDAVMPFLMNGLPRVLFGSEFNYILLLFSFLDPYWVYVFNRLLMVIIGFIGMFLVLKNHFIQIKNNDYLIILGVSLCFAILPFWSPGNLSVAGQPLILYAFLNIRANRFRFTDWLIILLFPFCSSLVTVGVFFVALIFILFVYDVFRCKKVNWIFFYSIVLITLIYCVVEYRLIYSMFFDKGFISHRSEFNRPYSSFIEACKMMKSNFLNGQAHVPSLHRRFVLCAVWIATIIMWNNKIIDKKYLIIGALIIFISVFYGLWYWHGMELLKNKIPILKSFQFHRFHWLQPSLWYILFAISLHYVWHHVRKGNIIVYGLLTMQLLVLFYHHEHIKNRSTPTFREFFATQQMAEIRDFIEKPQSEYRVVSIGLHSSILQYNEFFTLDGYFSNYPLEYKYEFRKIIEPELLKNEDMKIYFDNWGSRCYIFSHELWLRTKYSYLYTKDKHKEIYDLNLNMNQLKTLGGEYVFSAVKINNSTQSGLTLLKKFTSDKSAWNIYLYKVL